MEDVRHDRSSQEQPGNSGLAIRSGELFLYSPNVTSARSPRPCVTLGAFRDGTHCLHFRLYLRKAGSYVITREGCSFALAEWPELAARVEQAIAALDARAERQEGGR